MATEWNVKKYPLESFSLREIQRHTNDLEWQRFRESLKGAPTKTKLDFLEVWYMEHINKTGIRAVCQVSNYINALKRSGLLGLDLKVRRG